MTPPSGLPPDPDLSGADPILALASSVRDLAERVEVQTERLSDATGTFAEGLAQHRRATRLAFAALIVGILGGAIALHVEISEVREAQRENREARLEGEAADCRSDNAVADAVVRAAAVAVEEAAVALAGDDPLSQQEARRIAEQVAEHVAADPALQQKECPSA